jgi:hypothetical protein
MLPISSSSSSSSYSSSAVSSSRPLKQLRVSFNCSDIDTDEISEIMFELGVLSVSVEVRHPTSSQRTFIFNPFFCFPFWFTEFNEATYKHYENAIIVIG